MDLPFLVRTDRGFSITDSQKLVLQHRYSQTTRYGHFPGSTFLTQTGNSPLDQFPGCQLPLAIAQYGPYPKDAFFRCVCISLLHFGQLICIYSCLSRFRSIISTQDKLHSRYLVFATHMVSIQFTNPDQIQKYLHIRVSSSCYYYRIEFYSGSTIGFKFSG